MTREGLVRFGQRSPATARDAARLLDQIAALLRHLDAEQAWRDADVAATYEQRRRESNNRADVDARLEGMNTIPEVAHFARVSTRTVERAIHNGDLSAYRIGTARRIPDEAVFRWLARRRTPPAEAQHDPAASH